MNGVSLKVSLLRQGNAQQNDRRVNSSSHVTLGGIRVCSTQGGVWEQEVLADLRGNADKVLLRILLRVFVN